MWGPGYAYLESGLRFFMVTVFLSIYIIIIRLDGLTDQTISRPSHLCNGNSHAGKTWKIIISILISFFFHERKYILRNHFNSLISERCGCNIQKHFWFVVKWRFLVNLPTCEFHMVTLITNDNSALIQSNGLLLRLELILTNITRIIELKQVNLEISLISKWFCICKDMGKRSTWRLITRN